MISELLSSLAMRLREIECLGMAIASRRCGDRNGKTTVKIPRIRCIECCSLGKRMSSYLGQRCIQLPYASLRRITMIFQRCRHIDIDININTDIDMDIYIDIKIDCTPRDLKLEDRICQKKKSLTIERYRNLDKQRLQAFQFYSTRMRAS